MNDSAPSPVSVIGLMGVLIPFLPLALVEFLVYSKRDDPLVTMVIVAGLCAIPFLLASSLAYTVFRSGPGIRALCLGFGASVAPAITLFLMAGRAGPEDVYRVGAFTLGALAGGAIVGALISRLLFESRSASQNRAS